MIGSYFQVKKFNKINTSPIILWSEAKHYWNIFSPVAEYFSKNNISFVYLACDELDRGLKVCKNSLYIGKSKKAHQFLNYLKADIVLMTTPGLGDLAIKRSKNVKHYIHLVHSPLDIHLYRRISFECFDSIFCSGPHQIRTLRTLERIRGTERKNLLETGCIYFDELLKNRSNQKPDKNTVLLAPTWGVNGILRIGEKIIQPLIENNLNIIIRPHPQSLKSESSLIQKLRKKYQNYKNLKWDMEVDGNPSMALSSVMISDLSGIMFDYVFLYKKPVISIDKPVNFNNMEGDDLDKLNCWELQVREHFGKVIQEEDISQIAQVVKSLVEKNISKDILEKSIYNFGKAGEVAGKQIMEIYGQLK